MRPRPSARRARPREALALFRGDPLADVADEPFADAEIRRLEELRLAAAELAIDDDLAAGRHHELVGEIEALLADEPAARAAARPAHARALPLRPPGRGARGLPARAGARWSRRSASSRRAELRRPARGDPAPGPGAGRRGRRRRAPARARRHRRAAADRPRRGAAPAARPLAARGGGRRFRW